MAASSMSGVGAMSDSGDLRWREHLVLWRPVLGLAAVQGSITLSWVIYRTYLPKLLTQLGFPEALAAKLLLIELILAIALEPLMGGLSDRVRYWVGSRFPFISLGVILSSALFIAIPASVAVGSLSSTMRWILPSLAVAWALAMTIFRSPVMVLLKQYAPATELPRAASVLVLVGGTLGAIAPFSSQFLLSLGPGITFAAGSIVLLVAVKVLRSLHPPEPPSSPATDTAVPFTSLLLGLMSIIGVSLGISWGFRFLSTALSQSILILLPEVNLKIFTSIVSLVVAIGSIPAGIVGARWGNSRTILIGITATVSFLLLMGFVPYSMAIVLAIVGLIAAFSLINNSAIPFIFGAVPPHRIGLGIGTYFGISGAASSLFKPLFGSLSTQPSTQATYSAIAFLVVGLCIAFNSLRMRSG